MNFRSLYIAALALFTVAASAGSAGNPDGFNTPSEHAISTSKTEDFGVYTKNDAFICLSKKITCGPKDQVFDENGYPRIDGKIEYVTYTRQDGKHISGFLIQKNYERVIAEMGGRLWAEMNGEDVGRGYMLHIHLLERNGEKKWVVVDTRATSNAVTLSVITQHEIPKLLDVGTFQKQLDTQGYITLNVNFDTGKALIRTEDRPTLDQIVLLLKSSPRLRLSVDGHTDNVGNAEINKQLSQQRANAIVEFLVREGAEKDRLIAKGFGAENPIADNRSEDGRRINRRVELVKLKK